MCSQQKLILLLTWWKDRYADKYWFSRCCQRGESLTKFFHGRLTRTPVDHYYNVFLIVLFIFTILLLALRLPRLIGLAINVGMTSFVSALLPFFPPFHSFKGKSWSAKRSINVQTYHKTHT